MYYARGWRGGGGLYIILNYYYQHGGLFVLQQAQLCEHRVYSAVCVMSTTIPILVEYQLPVCNKFKVFMYDAVTCATSLVRTPCEDGR